MPDAATAHAILAAHEIAPHALLALDNAAGLPDATTLDRHDAILLDAATPDSLAPIDRALFDRGFLRVASDGALYLRSALIRDPHATGGGTRATISMSHFGHNAGFANQLFQYAFLKLYGLRTNCAVETPAWIGEQVYGIPPRPITHRFPEYRGDEWSVRDLVLWEMDNPPVDVDFWGYYQNVPASWRRHRAFVRRLFTPLPQWRAPVERWLARHHPPGTTLVALHVRRGDYRNYADAKPWFRLIPEDWYRRWLDALWPTLRNPVLFIASDERDAVLPAFADYAPLTAAALEHDMPEPRALADFQILAAADSLAIGNSSFSRMAALLADPAQSCFIPAPATEAFEPYDAWAPDHFWQRFGAPEPSERPRWLRKRAAR